MSAKMTEREALALTQEILDTVDRWHERLATLRGVRVRILSKYNGQMYGRSKPALTGQIRKIARTSVSETSGVIFWLEGFEYGCPALALDEVEFVGDDE